MGINPYAQYQRTQVETADQGRLLLMLYEGALRFLGRARRALEAQDKETANNNMVRAQEIIAELMSALDLNAGEVALSLFRLYEYMHYLLVQANIKKDRELLGQVEGMLLELREAWRGAIGTGEAAAPGGAEEAALRPPQQGGQEEKAAAPQVAQRAALFNGYHPGPGEGEGQGYRRVNLSG